MRRSPSEEVTGASRLGSLLGDEAGFAPPSSACTPAFGRKRPSPPRSPGAQTGALGLSSSEKTATLGTPSHLACLKSWTEGAAQHFGQLFHVVFSAASTQHLGAVPTGILGEYFHAGLVSNRTETLPPLP